MVVAMGTTTAAMAADIIAIISPTTTTVMLGLGIILIIEIGITTTGELTEIITTKIERNKTKERIRTTKTMAVSVAEVKAVVADK